VKICTSEKEVKTNLVYSVITQPTKYQLYWAKIAQEKDVLLRYNNINIYYSITWTFICKNYKRCFSYRNFLPWSPF
jgi:hypothetical protein